MSKEATVNTELQFPALPWVTWEIFERGVRERLRPLPEAAREEVLRKAKTFFEALPHRVVTVRLPEKCGACGDCVQDAKNQIVLALHENMARMVAELVGMWVYAYVRQGWEKTLEGGPSAGGL
jgi:hypothetical protein